MLLHLFDNWDLQDDYSKGAYVRWRPGKGVMSASLLWADQKPSCCEMRIPTVGANVGNISALHSIVFRPGLSTRVLCAQDRDMSGGGCSYWAWPLKDIGGRLRSSSDGVKTYINQNGRGELGYTEFQIDGGWSGVVTCQTPWRPLLATAPRRGTAEAARRLPAPVRSIGRPGAAPEPGRGQLVRTVWMSS